jgi:peptide chain release factor 2
VITFDPDRLRTRLAELEAAMGEPGFWDDQQLAARISTEHARLSRRVDRYDRLRQEYNDARELLALDGDLGAEISAALELLRRELEKLQEDALFTGEYDAGDAVVTIHAGTGGTDAQDWTEMLLRMYLRWAADRGFDTELVEARTPTGSSRPSAAFTASSGCRRTTRHTAATPRSRR